VVTILAYIGHPGGMQEYETVRGLVEALPTEHWVTSEARLLNRPSAPILLTVWRLEAGRG